MTVSETSRSVADISYFQSPTNVTAGYQCLKNGTVLQSELRRIDVVSASPLSSALALGLG
jgi:hypothetical protein